MPNPSVRFIYLPCNDLDAMRSFYTDLVGLNEIYFAEDERMLAYDCDGLQFTIMESAEPVAVGDAWARQPGWQGGQAATTSWSVVMTEQQLRDAVPRVTAAGVTSRLDEPEWVGYWSFPVRDPMGTTVELTHAPESAPNDTSWAAAGGVRS